MKKCVCRSRRRTALSRRERLELRVYRALGVRPFRRLLLALERIRRGKSGRINQNYHFKKVSPAAAEAFGGYLLYHTLLHLVSLLLALALLAFMAAVPLRSVWMCAAACLMCVLNLWCIMLQRYNCLRIRDLRERHRRIRQTRARRAAAGSAAVSPEYGREQMLEDLAFVRHMRAELSAGRSVFLDRGHAAGLLRLAALTEHLEGPSAGTGCPETPADAVPIGRLAALYGAGAQPYSGLERRVDGLQRRLPWGGVPLLDLAGCAVVTACKETEAAFGRAFPGSAPEQILERSEWLAAALERACGESGERCACKESCPAMR